MPGGYKDWASEVASSSDIDNYLMRQTRMRFDDVAARDAALTAPEDGMFCITLDTHSVWSYDSDVPGWVPLSTPWTNYTPAWTNFTPGSGVPAAAYRYQDGELRVSGQFECAADTSSTGVVFQTIPNGETAGSRWQGGVGIYNKPSAPSIIPLVIGVTLGGTSFAWVASTGLLDGSVGAGFEDDDVLTWDFTIGVA